MADKKRGKRYSAAEKQEVIDFVESINSEKGRGGVAQASRKFGISQLTISSWVKKAGGIAPNSKKTAKKTTTTTKGGFSGQLRRIADLHDEIETTKQKLDSLEKEFAKLKKKL